MTNVTNEQLYQEMLVLSNEIREIVQEVRQSRTEMQILNAKILGAEDGTDGAHGRIPRLESDLEKIDARVLQLEKTDWGARGIAWIIAFLATVGSAVFGLHQLLRR